MRVHREAFEGFIIEEGAAGLWVLDWDYETEQPLAFCPSVESARAWILRYLNGGAA